MLEEDSQQFDTSLVQKQIKSLLIFSMGIKIKQRYRGCCNARSVTLIFR